MRTHGNINKKAFLLIDLQEGLFQGKKSIYESTKLLEIILTLEKQAHDTFTPIVYIRHANSGLLKKNSKAWQLYSKLKPTKNDLILDKTDNNAFVEPKLDLFLKEKEIDTVIISGLVSKCCIRATCLGAKDMKYTTILVQDGHSGFRKNSQVMIEIVNDELERHNIILEKANKICF